MALTIFARNNKGERGDALNRCQFATGPPVSACGEVTQHHLHCLALLAQDSLTEQHLAAWLSIVSAGAMRRTLPATRAHA
ncbi:hypothetical protein FTUN_6679 [Frigoriglobus tundricola]|uniref:Uncharacterized protein n=1 Tax=Frigoriglobus tundricola TaxID=2774151 RepID=A0A6M5Z100_9BACT|nr:hypothetical protein FTUN_6679 [Frigoriglobus tundricola]